MNFTLNEIAEAAARTYAKGVQPSRLCYSEYDGENLLKACLIFAAYVDKNPDTKKDISYLSVIKYFGPVNKVQDIMDGFDSTEFLNFVGDYTDINLFNFGKDQAKKYFANIR